MLSFSVHCLNWVFKLSVYVEFFCSVFKLSVYFECLCWAFCSVFKLSVFVKSLLMSSLWQHSPRFSVDFFCLAFMWHDYFVCWYPLLPSTRHHVVLLTTARCRLWSCAVHLSMALYLAVPVFSRSNSNTWFTWSMRPLIAL